MVSNDEVLSVIRSRGPIIPNNIRKITNASDTIIIGAILSQLSSEGKILISKTKQGGSPFYYIEEQKPLLENLIQYLDPKDQKTVQYLKQEKVLKDHDLDLFHRVSLRKIIDFAKQFTVKIENTEKTFWKYYLVTNSDAMEIVKHKYLGIKKAEEIKVEEVKNVKPNNQPKEELTSQKTKNEDVKSEMFAKLKEQKTKSEERVKVDKKEEQEQIILDNYYDNSEFFSVIKQYFINKNITPININCIKKDREYNCISIIPSPVGNIKTYCVAKNKKKLQEGDVAPGYLKAKKLDLPLLFLTTGEFSKKTLTAIEKDYGSLNINYI